MRTLWNPFWAWYERHYVLNLSVAASLFVLQIVHLYWLGAEPIATRVGGQSLFDPGGLLRYVIYLVDYAEIPALLGASLIYVNVLRRGFSPGPLVLLLFLNSQWLHIFWITDEYVTSELSGTPAASGLPAWLAWVAILIDYLELPVIFDTLRRFAEAIRNRGRPRVASAP